MSEEVKVGQVWAHLIYTHRWKVICILNGNLYALCLYPQENGTWLARDIEQPSNLGRVELDGTFTAFGDWHTVSERTFSRINQKTLRKRIRDQLTQQILMGKS